ncbi:MAG: DUF5058 family protein [Lachnospiraceae bacterium]|nr:DUF5058 family protein [Lachnospiraceae bacterium]
MNEYLSQVNAPSLYFIVGGVLLFIAIMCVVFIVKSYRAGIAIGMDPKVLKRAITSSATFTVLPSISILLGVVALSGSLGVPISWLRLSVVGALQYELNVAEIAATAMGLTGLKVTEMSVSVFVTVVMVMTVGILGGVLCCIFGLKAYLGKVKGKKKNAPEAAEKADDANGDRSEAKAGGEEQEKKKPGFGAYATVAMFIGLCSAYIGSYVGTFARRDNFMPLMTALISALVMAVFEYFTVKKGKAWLDNFSVATSMLVGMIAAVVVNLL